MTSRSSYTSRNTQAAHCPAASSSGLAGWVCHQHRQHWVISHIYAAPHHPKVTPKGILKTPEWGDFWCILVLSDIRALTASRDEGNNDIGDITAQEDSFLPTERTGGKSFKFCTYFRRIICFRKWPSNKTWTYTNWTHPAFQATALGCLWGAGNDLDLHLPRPFVIPSQFYLLSSHPALLAILLLPGHLFSQWIGWSPYAGWPKSSTHRKLCS